MKLSKRLDVNKNFYGSYRVKMKNFKKFFSKTIWNRSKRTDFDEKIYVIVLESAMHCNSLSNQLGYTEKVRVPCVFLKQSGVLSSYDSGTNLVYRLGYFGILVSVRNSLKFVQ